MSSQPSPSASKKAQPGPSVSGSHFLPSRPELCSKWRFASAVTSVNRTGSSAGRGGAVRHPAMQARLRSVIVNRLSLIVILGTQLSGASGQLLRGLIRFKAPEQSFLDAGLVRQPQSPVAEHQIVVR